MWVDVNIHLCIGRYGHTCVWVDVNIHLCIGRCEHTCVWADVTSQLAQLHWCIAALSATMWFLIRVSVADVPNKLARRRERCITFLKKQHISITSAYVYRDPSVVTNRVIMVKTDMAEVVMCYVSWNLTTTATSAYVVVFMPITSVDICSVLCSAVLDTAVTGRKPFHNCWLHHRLTQQPLQCH